MLEERNPPMKRPRFHLPRIDVHSLEFQTSIELAVGGVLTALLLRWMM
jgi:hypothetical protein